MNTVLIRVKTKDNRMITTYAYLDTCSNRHFATTEFKNRLGLTGQKRCLSIDTAIGTKDFVNAEVVTFNIENIDGSTSCELEWEVLPLKHLKRSDIPVKADVESFPQVRHLVDVKVDVPQVSLIIGARSWELFIPTEIFKNDDSLCLFHTPIGYVFFGASNEPRKVHEQSAISHFIDARPMEHDLHELWQTEDSENVYDNRKHP